MTKNNILQEIIQDSDERKKEIIDFISVVNSIESMEYYYIVGNKKRKNPNFHIKKDFEVVVKSGIVIFYSHWEWLIKYSWKKFLEYLKTLNLTRENLPSSFIEYYIKKNEKNLTNILSTLLDDKSIEVYDSMIDDLLNIDEKNLKYFFEKMWFNFDYFLESFRIKIESITGLYAWSNFIERVKQYKKQDNFLVEYIVTNKEKIDLIKTLENILQVNTKDPNMKSLLVLRHKIAHWVDVKIDIHRLRCLWEISIMLLDIFIESFKKSIMNNSNYI